MLIVYPVPNNLLFVYYTIDTTFIWFTLVWIGLLIYNTKTLINYNTNDGINLQCY